MKVQLKKRIRGANEALFRRMTERMMNMPESAHVVKVPPATIRAMLNLVIEISTVSLSNLLACSNQ